MPSYKKRVHSQRIPQPGRPAVTPYEGAYDEKYSSDEENIEYEVDEPDDITERSNSTVTFSEDIYDSDVIEEMMKNRKPSQAFQDNQDLLSPSEGPKVPKSILKDKGGKKKEGLTSTFVEPDAKGTGTEKAESTDTIVSPGGVPKILEETMADELERISEAITAGKDKVAEKGENILEDLTKETDKGTSEVKGEKEVVTKPMPSTISQQIDQITKTAATNQDELAKQDDSVTKPLQDILADKSTDKKSETFEKVVLDKHKTTEAEIQIPASFKASAPEVKQDESEVTFKAQDILSEPILSKDILNQLEKISEPTADSHKLSKEFSDEQTKIFTTDNLGTDLKPIIEPEKPPSGDIIKESQIIKDKVTETLQDEFQKVDKLPEPLAKTTKKVEISVKDVQDKSPEDIIPKLTEAMIIEKENATKKAVELIDDITKTVQEIFPTSVEETATLKLETVREVAPQPKTEETQPLQDLPTKTDSVTEVISGEKIANGISKIIPQTADISKEIEKALEPEIRHDIVSHDFVTPVLEKGELPKETTKLLQDVKDSFQIDKDDSKSPKEILTETVAKDIDKLSQVATSLKDDFSQASSKIIDDVTQTIDKVSDRVKDVTDKALKTENGVAKPLQEALTTETEKISSMITTSQDEMTKKGDLIVEKLGKEADKLSEKVSAVTGKAEEMLKSVQEAVSTKPEQVTKMAESIKDELSEKGEQLLKDVGKPFTETIPKEFDKVSKAIKEKSDKIGNGFTKEIDTVSDSVVSVKEDILKGSEKAFQDSKKVLEESTTVLSTEIDNFIKEGDNVIQRIQKTVTESVPETVKDSETISKDRLVGTSATVESHSSFDDYAPGEVSESVRETVVKETDKKSEAIKSKAGSILSDISSGLTKSIQGSFSAITGETLIDDMITDSQVKVVDSKPLSEEEEIPSKVGEIPDQAESADKFDAKEPRRSESEDSKPRVIFRIESQEELLSDLDRDPFSPTSTEEFAEKIKKDLKASLEREQLKLEEKLASKAGIFDISGESLSRTKELVDERLRKISEVKPPKELEEPVKKEKPPKKTEFTETIKIGRFHVTPALVEEVVKKKKENEIAQRLKTSRQGEQEVKEEVEREISEKLTEADFEEVIRELKLEGLNTEVYFLPEEKEKKKERTLKRVERRFERMASETLEKEKEEADSVSEEKLDEKREVEFQRMLSQLSSEEVAECQQEYLQLWEEGGLSSLTPTEDWESRDPDTPENELDEDSPRKSESFRGSHGTGKNGEPFKPSEPKKPDTSAKSPVSPPKPLRVSDKIPVPSGAQSVSVVEPLHEAAPSSDLVSDKSDDVPSYVDRKKFWEQMSSSQSGETVTDSLPSALQTISATEVETKTTEVTTEDVISVKTVKQKFEKDFKSTESRKSFEEGGLVKSLTESYSQKIAAGELVMPAIPRPRSGVPKESPDRDTEPIEKEVTPDSTGTAIVSELEIKLKSRSPGAPITETTVIPGSTSLEKEAKDVEFTIGSTIIAKTKTEEKKPSQEQSTDSEAEFVAKYGAESVAYDNTTLTEDDDVALPLSERKKIFEGAFDKRPPPVVPIRKSVHERSMSLPTSELADGVKSKKKFFEEEMKKEIIVEQIMTQAEEPTGKPEEKEIIPKKEQVEEKVIPEAKKPDTLLTDLVKTSTTMVKETLKTKETTLVKDSGKLITTAVKTGLKLIDKVPKTLDLKEAHVDKSETEDNEKEKLTKTPQKKEDEPVPSITITATAKKQIETASIGESEDTQSESDVTPEEARVVDNGDTPWDGSGTQSGGISPGDDITYPKEIGETGIGRWVGQEDLSKQIWERDDEIEAHYRVPTAWERTRSEGASPKEHYVYTPEEHYPDTVWEVPVQEQLETEEITHDIPIEKQVIIEKDEEEEEEDEDERKVRLTEDEAKELAEDILDYIQFEVENRASFLATDSDEGVQDVMHPQVTDYLHHLADKKDLDDQDIQLIESVILKKQRDRLKKTPTVGTTTSSVDITDEDLRSSGADNDISPVESQISKLQSLEERDYPQLSTEVPENLETVTAQEIVKLDETEKTAEKLNDVDIVDQTIAEVKESLEAAKEELIEQHMLLEEVEVFERDTSEFQFKLITEQVQDLETVSDHEVEERQLEPIKTEEQEEMYTTKTEKKTEEHTTDEFESDQILKTIQTKTTEIVTPSGKTTETSKAGVKKPETHIPEDLEISAPESFVSRKMGDTRYSSEESQRSTSLEDPMKSPPMGEDMLSSSSAEKPGDLKSEKSDVVFRHSSSSSLNVQLKADRRSGTDVEPYSSSGESHYQSFEHTSSRPCSSDVEALMASNICTTCSSEYESALSQDVSSKPTTSMEYHTAVSSLSSRESIKSLDSESSGHLASVEVSSEASETLIPSALELDKDIETPATVCSDDESSGRKFGRPPAYVTQMSAPATTSKPSVDDDFEIVSEADVVSWAGEASEEEDGTPPTGEEVIPPEDQSQKMKRSYEMTFQPEPKPIIFESLEFPKEKYPFILTPEEYAAIMSVFGDKYESSFEETGSMLSTSVSTTSDTSAVRTVIELSRTDSDKMDASLTMSATSIDSASREELDITETQVPQTLTSEMSTSTTIQGINKKTASVTITTSTSDEHGISNVSTQVTSVSRKSSMVDESKTDSDSQPSSRKGSDTVSHANGPTQVEYVPDYDEVETKTKKTQGHRRKESTSSFVPTMMWNVTEARPQRVKADITEIEEEYVDDKYVYDISLTEKEVKNDEKKEADDSEKGEEPYEPGFEKYAQERQISEGEEIEELKDFDRPQSQISRTDSESGRRPVSSIFSEDQPDSELSELMKQGSSETERDDPLERPLSPEPEDIENKDITPEFSSEAQASVTELEMEYTSACSRRDEYASHVSPIREERSELQFKGTTSEESVEEEKPTEQLRSQKSIDTVEEKHELERGEKEILKRKDHTEKDIPNITVTEHTPTLSTQKFQYPDTEEETKEKKSVAKTPDTPASTSSRTSSSSTDQGREYNIEEAEMKRFFHETLTEEKEVSETKDEKESLDSPSSDSFEMLDKPDISDEYVIIEEVGREAQENDAEGKSIQIATRKKKIPKKVKQEEEVIVSPPPTATKMTDIKYFPSEEDSDQFLLESESPPQPTTRRFAELLKKKSGKEEKDEPEYDPQIEQSKKWVEMQFQGEQAAKVIGAYGYEMEFERAPLEDIKEEDINELDSSSKIGSMGSQKESLGSFGSVKDSFSSTPDYDVLAGKKYFTRSGDHDDVSMSSLQEFELIEKKILENGKKSGSSSSQDSLSSKKLGTSSKSGQGDDVSQGSLREFENLEHACATVVTMETKAKQEEAILSEIDEGHESQISESESCETVSAVMREKIESDTEDFDKRMFEIDEIIRQAQSNVEKFSELQAMEKIESMGRGDSYEEVAKVPDLELDMPLRGKPTYDHQNPRQDKGAKSSYSTQIVTKKKMQQWRESEAAGLPAYKTKPETSKQSDLLENGGKIKSISVDSLEIQAKEKQILLEGKDDTVSLDSYKSKPEKSEALGFSQLGHKSDSLEEFSASLRHHESSSGDYSSSGRDDQPPPRADFMLGSSESLDPSSSTATHATYQYETDSVMSSSFTSGGSNTMVSSTDNLDLLASGQSVIDLGAAKADDWLENLQVGGDDPFATRLAGQGVEVQKVTFKGPDAKKSLEEWAKDLGPAGEIVEMEEVDEHGNVHVKKVLRQRVLIRPDQVNLKDLTKEALDEYLKNAKEKTVAYREKLEMGTIEPFVSEIIEPVQDEEFSHVVHKKFQMVPEVEKVVFRGPDAQEALEEYVKGLNTGEEIEETEEVDEHGNVHVTRMIRQRVVVQPGKTRQDEATEMIHRKIEMPPEVERVSFKGPDAEKALRDYMASVKPDSEITESEYVDEDGNVHVRKVITERKVVRPEGLSKEELQEYMKQMESQGRSQHTQGEVLQLGGNVQKIVFKGPDAEEQMREYLASIKPEGEVTEEEEVDEFGNVHVRKILRQQVVIRPDQAGRELTKQELEQYLTSGQYEVAGTSQRMEMAPDVQKVVFKGPNAEEQMREYLAFIKPEGEVTEEEEVDEFGNVHVRKILRQQVVIRPDQAGRELTKQELEQYLTSGQYEVAGTSQRMEMAPDVQKVVFKGPNAEEQMREYLASIKPEGEVTEEEEVDEFGNVHVRKILRQQVVIRPDQAGRELTKQELEQYLTSGQYEVAGTSQRMEMAPDVQKLVFKGPDAEEQLQEYMKNLKPEVEEIEEVDEDGNVHIKRIIRQRVVMRPEDLSQQLSTEGSSTVQKISFSGPDAEGALQEYLAGLDPEQEVTEIEEKDEHGNIHVKKVLKQRVVIRPEEIGGRQLTKEELEEYLRRKTGQTTLHYENIDIGSREPFVSETIEPLDESQYSHIVHRTVQMAPDVHKVVFKGPNAEEALKAYVEALEPGEDVIEKEEVDEQGNVHLTRVMRRKIVMKPEDLTKTGLSGEELKHYLKHVEHETFQEGGGDPHASSFDPTSSTNLTLTEAFSSSIKLTDKDQSSHGEKDDTESASATQKESGSSQRPPLVSDISMDDEAEHDPTEHDWRHQLEFLHAEAAEDEIDENLDEILSASSIRAQRKH